MNSIGKERKGITRREFVKRAAGGTAAVAGTGLLAAPAAAAAQSPEPWLPEKWDYEADVVVVGFGGAGGCAAIEAHDAGAKVIILEKTPTPGGSTTLCAGIFYAAGTSVQKAEGITDTADEMYKYAMNMGKGLADPELVRVWVDHAAENLEWIKSMGAEFSPMGFSGGERDPENAAITPPKPRGHYTKAVKPTYPYPPKHPTATASEPANGTGYFKPLFEGVKERGIEVLMETRAVALVTNPLTTEVLGVKAEQDGKTVYVRAAKAVALTAGGYSQGKDLAECFCKEVLLAENYTASDTGDGILMAMAIGAGVKNMDQSLLSLSIPSGAIAVNSGGRRFVDETLYRVNGEVWKGQRDWLAWAIFDDETKGTTEMETIQAPTIAELAEKIGVDPAVLENTVEFYNESVELGKDREFGRTQRARHLADPVVPMVPIKTPPFHAVKRDYSNTRTSQGITMGGLRINTKAQVLFGVTDKVIPRLYAAGRTAVGSMGEMYVGSGQAVSDAFTFGRIAGQNAAEEKAWK